MDLLLQEFPEEAFGRAGLEGAVWDLWANRKGRPLWALLGGEAKPVPSGVAIGLMPLEELLQRVKKYREEGYRRVKIKIEPGCDVAPVKAIRKRFGDIPLMVPNDKSFALRASSRLTSTTQKLNSPLCGEHARIVWPP